MMSSTGVTNAETLELRAIAMPTGSPIRHEMMTATKVMIRVSMLGLHRPNTPKSSREIPTMIAGRSPAKA